jgi:hypothetical protein
MSKGKWNPTQKYLKNLATGEVWPYTEALMARGDMIEHDPFSHHNQDSKPVEHPGTGKGSEIETFTREVLKLDREYIREELGKCKNKLQRIFWCLLNLWEKCPSALLADFSPRYRDLSIMMGPSFTVLELKHALEIFKSNPNKEYLMSDAVNECIPSEGV